MQKAPEAMVGSPSPCTAPLRMAGPVAKVGGRKKEGGKDVAAADRRGIGKGSAKYDEGGLDEA